jgi:hypothetical protein
MFGAVAAGFPDRLFPAMEDLRLKIQEKSVCEVLSLKSSFLNPTRPAFDASPTNS